MCDSGLGHMLHKCLVDLHQVAYFTLVNLIFQGSVILIRIHPLRCLESLFGAILIPSSKSSDHFQILRIEARASFIFMFPFHTLLS